jgi:hypothetical protein
MIFPTQLGRSGYNTAGYGKIAHWETEDRMVWNYDSWDNNWYDYQSAERRYMNASTMPDAVWKDEDFRDFKFTSRAIETFHKLAKEPQYFALGIGFKLPHLCVHVPYEYYNMYKTPEKMDAWKLTRKEMRFPISAPDVAYRCCADPDFRYMEEEGKKRSRKSVRLNDINYGFNEVMRDELMLGYCGAITFVDKLLGKLLDVIDEYEMWNNITVILTSDHGMHNGEKGMWEKWTMYEETLKVPLMIAHPQSPFHGQTYPEPVELIDIYPTINDILNAPKVDMKKMCSGGGIYVCHPLQGKSLARIVLGETWHKVEVKRAKEKAKEKAMIKNKSAKKETTMLIHRRLSKDAQDDEFDDDEVRSLVTFDEGRFSTDEVYYDVYGTPLNESSVISSSNYFDISDISAEVEESLDFDTETQMDHDHDEQDSHRQLKEVKLLRLESRGIGADRTSMETHRGVSADTKTAKDDKNKNKKVQKDEGAVDKKEVMPHFIDSFAISQSWRCAPRPKLEVNEKGTRTSSAAY